PPIKRNSSANINIQASPNIDLKSLTNIINADVNLNAVGLDVNIKGSVTARIKCYTGTMVV
ncbi:hypothetical protein NAI59_11930, partial [Francisella tularensis subsp. holarctica]|nr:hypothetical protein [Francisella tularensis subsp. holarctica]